ncbi:hypothetical protein DM860_003514 [Cuscuta australis]|uniref:Uncharacterized protein n=1 Tax=Cuscuta australis TaxID=267555 RepID=A0A328DG40_9ASTE|nr:hypothetical protein DM860_003514 [Cuscuta australis]
MQRCLGGVAGFDVAASGNGATAGVEPPGSCVKGEENFKSNQRMTRRKKGTAAAAPPVGHLFAERKQSPAHTSSLDIRRGHVPGQAPFLRP